MSLLLSSGSPTRSLPSRAASLARIAAATPSCTSRREPAQQTWPWLNQIEVDHALDRAVDVGVVEDDERRLAAELQRQALAAARRRLADRPADLGRAGEGDLVDPGMRDQRRAGGPCPGDDIDHPGRQPDLDGRSARREARSAASARPASAPRCCRRRAPARSSRRASAAESSTGSPGRRPRAGGSPGTRSPAPPPSRRDGRSAGPPAARRCRGSRGWSCRCRASRAPRRAGVLLQVPRQRIEMPRRASVPGSAAHPGCALRAAATARSTSASPASATCASTVAGSRVERREACARPSPRDEGPGDEEAEAAGRAPSIQSSAGAAASGAGPYSRLSKISFTDHRRAPQAIGVAVGGRIAAGDDGARAAARCRRAATTRRSGRGPAPASAARAPPAS